MPKAHITTLTFDVVGRGECEQQLANYLTKFPQLAPAAKELLRETFRNAWECAIEYLTQKMTDTGHFKFR